LQKKKEQMQRKNFSHLVIAIEHALHANM